MIKKEDVFSEKYKSTNYLLTLNGSILIGYFTVFQISVTQSLQRWLLLLSFLGFALSFFLLLWYRIRWPKRDEVFDKLREKTTKHIAGGLADFVENIIRPLTQSRAKLEIKEALESAKSEEEFTKIQQSLSNGSFHLKGEGESKIDSATRTVVESFVENIQHQSKVAYNKAYKKPLKERHPRKKFLVDIISAKTRIHTLIGASVLLAFSIIIAIIQIPQE